MLAEIFMLRLGAATRAAREAPAFVPISLWPRPPIAVPGTAVHFEITGRESLARAS